MLGVFKIMAVILLIYNFWGFIKDIKNYFNTHHGKIKNISSKIKDYFSESIGITRWKVLIPLLLILGFLIIPYFTSEEKEASTLPTVEITENLYYGDYYEAGIDPSKLNRTVTLNCDVPSFLNITKMFPQAEPIPTDNGNKLIWKGEETIQLGGSVEEEFTYPFHIKANFKPPVVRKRENSYFDLSIFKLSDINKKRKEFIYLTFYCKGCSINSKNNNLKKIVESSKHEFYGWVDLDREDETTFEFVVASEEEVRLYLELIYYSKGIINCSVKGAPINYNSNIYYSNNNLPQLNISS